jgi:lipoprotein signal peptidase
MLRALAALLVTAASAAAIDLAFKAGAAAAPLHQRSALYVVVVLAGSLAWGGAVVLTRSVGIAAAGGLVLGGAAGNLLSLAIWTGVPNPIVVEPLAFNLADLFVFVGFGLVCAAAAGIAIESPERLREPLRLR